jgi:hypothetical protein
MLKKLLMCTVKFGLLKAEGETLGDHAQPNTTTTVTTHLFFGTSATVSLKNMPIVSPSVYLFICNNLRIAE